MYIGIKQQNAVMQFHTPASHYLVTTRVMSRDERCCSSQYRYICNESHHQGHSRRAITNLDEYRMAQQKLITIVKSAIKKTMKFA